MDILALIKERAGEYDCPVCHRSLDGCGLELLRDDAPMYTVEVSCGRCDATFVVVLRVRGGTRRRPAPRRIAPPIGADELLDVHERLRSHRGPLTELLRR